LTIKEIVKINETKTERYIILLSARRWLKIGRAVTIREQLRFRENFEGILQRRTQQGYGRWSAGTVKVLCGPVWAYRFAVEAQTLGKPLLP
jgi:hypothetical protein